MPDADVDVVRRALEAWQRDDLDGFMALIDPAVEWHTAMERLVGGVESFYEGAAGVRELWSVYRTEMEDFRVDAQELRAAADGRLLLLGHVRWRGPASGIDVESEIGLVLTVAEGRIRRSVDYLSRAEALQAAGLEE